MRKYDSYKPTKIEFLDEIPEHWEEKRMRFLGYLYGGLSGKSATDFNQLTNENNKYFIPFTNIANNFRIDSESLQTVVISENENQNTVQKGDLFFLMSSENYDDVGKSAVLLDDLEETYLNSFCKGFRITKDDIAPEFLNYQLHSKQLRHNLLTGANGFTRINLKIDKVIDLLTALPTPEEQTAIAAYLDRKTAEIDELIADKKRLLELYEEEKNAIINQAVTKGINPDVPMKDSGIEWLGDIPEHWEVRKANSLISVKRGAGYQYITEVFGDEDFEYVLRISDFNNYDPIRALKTEELGKYRVATGEILIAGTGASAGITMYVDEKMDGLVHSYNALRISVSKPFVLFNKYLFFLFQSHILNEQMSLAFTGSAQHFLDVGRITSFLITLPDFQEQQSIVRHIETECARIDAKKAKTEKLIELLTEYRTALISEVVTGKIKVIE